MAREMFEQVIGLPARTGWWCSATRSTASSSTIRPPAAGCVRPRRAGRLARQHLQELRPAGAADRLDRHPRCRPARGRHHAEGLHDHLRERAERVPDRAGAPPPPGPARPQPRDRAPQPAAAGRLLRAARRNLRVGPPDGKPDRLPPRHGLGDVDPVLRAARRGRRPAPARLGLRPARPCPHRLRPGQHARGPRPLEASLTNGQRAGPHAGPSRGPGCQCNLRT